MRLSKDEKEYISLSWQLIRWKVAYYRPESVHPSRVADVTVDDDTYDAAERRYLDLIVKLNKKYGEGYAVNTLVHKGYPGYPEALWQPPHCPMMEVDETRPSVQLVMKHLRVAK